MDTNSWPEGLIRSERWGRVPGLTGLVPVSWTASSGSADWGREVRRAPPARVTSQSSTAVVVRLGGSGGGDWSHMSHGCLDLMAACGVEAGGDAIAGSPRSSRSIINLNYRRSKLQRGLQAPGWEEG